MIDRILFERVAQRLGGKDRLGAQQLRLASAHWLRHTSASTAVAAGVPLDVVGALLGHASLTTTSQYVHAESHRLAKEMKKLWKQLARSNVDQKYLAQLLPRKAGMASRK